MRFAHGYGATLCLLQRTIETYLTFSKTGESSPALKGLTTMFLSNLIGVYRQWRRYNESVRELNRLGDRELADIGISRGDIPRVAWENSER
jgi:uncharacterized protein YjiS (DUF1127 family)